LGDAVILFKQKKIGFVFPPRTGSSTAESFLLKAQGYVKLPKRHQLILDLKNPSVLTDYKIYSFLRNPIDRTVSCIKAFKPIFNCNTFDEFIDNFDANIKPDNVVFMPQSKWFEGANVIALDFDNYESELRKATEGLGLEEIPIVHRNQSVVTDEPVTEKVINFVKSRYAEDYALIKDRLGKEY
jgi:hypothetical protein